MTKPIRLDDEAIEELEAAAAWYEAHRTNLGLEFTTVVREAFRRIGEAPRRAPLVPYVPERLGVRRFLLRRFPYAVVFLELDGELRVLSIAHTSREPGFWRGRI